MQDQLDQVATMFEGESFYSTLRTKCWDVCVHSTFDREKAIEATYAKGKRDRMEPYDGCLRRCLGRLNTTHEEISEEFVKNIEAMVQRNQMMEAAGAAPVPQGGGFGAPPSGR
eukprot:TRINITY_DN25714_c0_g1_i1.p1 TRINITY_DN25714_c0_g1~~TRINITY_DN25714_c0_g1_i1.p1  ORF type:complete len:126 (+),score=25.67 TRINITY_DN25714_c0_g1_i1:42-380(+)